MRQWLLVYGVLALAVPSSDGLLGQGATGRVTGIVTAEETGQPIGDAHITIPNTRLGAVTGSDGRYTFNALPVGKHDLRATRIGFTPTVVQGVIVVADSTATVDFQLKRQTIELEQVVVVGYGTQRRKDVTGAVSSVSEKELQESKTANPLEALKGKVAGVDITTSSYRPGADIKVRIRGERSIKASNDPLYVLDGIPMAGGIGDLSSSDIESIEVLKDASSTAIYGSRGANGVVLITSRQGRRGATRVTYDTYAGAQKIIRKIDMMNGVEFTEYKKEAARAIGKPVNFDPTELASIASGRSTDWQSEVSRTGAQVSHQVGVSGGNDKTRVSLTANHLNQQGVTKTEDFLRQSARINFDHQASDKFRVGASSLIARSIQNRTPGDVWDLALRTNPLGYPRDEAGVLRFRPTTDGLVVNAVSEYENSVDEWARTRLFSTLFAEYDIAEGLSLRTNFGPDITFRRIGRFSGSETAARAGGSPDAQQEDQRIYAYTLDNILRYRKEWGGQHRMDATMLYSVQRERAEGNFLRASGLPYPQQLFYDLGSGSRVEGVWSYVSQWALQSYMSRLNYEWRDKYLLTATGRLDGSSRLAEGNKYAFFPSLALGWRLSEEPFLQGKGWFSDLKLRASWGRTGNTSIDPYQTLGSLGRTQYNFGDAGANGYRPSELANPNLRWEKTETVDAGIEFASANQRVFGSMDVYRQNTSDLLLLRQLPPTTGYTQILENVGKTRNTGLELAVTTVNLPGDRSDGLRWTTTFNFATNRNSIISLDRGAKDDVGNRWFIGQPIQVFYDLEFAGIWQRSDSLLASQYSRLPGQIRVTDRTGPVPCPTQAQPNLTCLRVSDKDRKILGTPFPSWTGSVSSRFDWKGVDLSVFVTTRQGYLVNSNFHTSFNSLAGRYNNLRVNYWTPTNPSNTDPRPNRDQEFPQDGGARAYKDGSFVRIRNITFGYTLPTRFASRSGAQSMRLYASAQDPFTFTKYDGFDPESGTSAATPSYRTLLAGLGLVF